MIIMIMVTMTIMLNKINSMIYENIAQGRLLVTAGDPVEKVEVGGNDYHYCCHHHDHDHQDYHNYHNHHNQKIYNSNS